MQPGNRMRIRAKDFRVKRNEPLTAAEDLRALFRKWKLGELWIPAAQESALKKRDDFWYSTLGETMNPYNFSHYVDFCMRPGGRDFLVVGHGGHGINSYAVSYYLRLGKVRLLLQFGWGGVYMPEPETTTRVARYFAVLSSFSAAIERAAVERQRAWKFAYAEFYGGRWDGEGERRWTGLRPEELERALAKLGAVPE